MTNEAIGKFPPAMRGECPNPMHQSMRGSPPAYIDYIQITVTRHCPNCKDVVYETVALSAKEWHSTYSKVLLLEYALKKLGAGSL